MYVVVTGCQWRQLPGDLPYWKTTYNYFRKWSKSKLWILIELELNQLVILKEDRNKTPSVLIVDS
jgi:transposase